jgi:hypothetical protein
LDAFFGHAIQKSVRRAERCGQQFEPALQLDAARREEDDNLCPGLGAELL